MFRKRALTETSLGGGAISSLAQTMRIAIEKALRIFDNIKLNAKMAHLPPDSYLPPTYAPPPSHQTLIYQFGQVLKG